DGAALDSNSAPAGACWVNWPARRCRLGPLHSRIQVVDEVEVLATLFCIRTASYAMGKMSALNSRQNPGEVLLTRTKVLPHARGHGACEIHLHADDLTRVRLELKRRKGRVGASSEYAVSVIDHGCDFIDTLWSDFFPAIGQCGFRVGHAGRQQRARGQDSR